MAASTSFTELRSFSHLASIVTDSDNLVQTTMHWTSRLSRPLVLANMHDRLNVSLDKTKATGKC